jgi:hopene-associated glycosyltransferase HpnB
LAALLAWAVLLAGRGGFWRMERLRPAPVPERWPEVVAVIPARDEAEAVGRTVQSLLAQDYPGRFTLILVDDHSTDGTAEVARRAAEAAGAAERLRVVAGEALPMGWTGKVWAMEQGLRAAAMVPDSGYVLFTDADIRHAPGQLRALVARAVERGTDLASLMVRLHCVTLPERALIPAFVFFFRMLYPFAWIADPQRRVAGAAGGVMLARPGAIAGIGGMAALKGALIDDCTLARRLKERGGRLWLGLADRTESLRVYRGWGEPWDMIARSAYDQLGHSPLALVGCVLAMLLVFAAPPLLALSGGPGAWAGALAWLAMTLAYAPMVRFYGLPWWWALTLAPVALLYLGATLHSAIRHHRGRGGQWKGRVEAGRAECHGGAHPERSDWAVEAPRAVSERKPSERSERPASEGHQKT